ncbi:sensor histidine kinase [Actinomadura vinacea]
MLLSLTALWAFAAWVTAREGINLLWVSTLDSVAEPSDPMLVDLQRERRLTIVYLAGPSQARRAALVAQRARTDKTTAVVLKQAASGSVKRAADDQLERRLADLSRLLHRLGKDRQAIDAGTMDRAQSFDVYSTINETTFRVYDSMATLDDDDFADTVRAQVALNRTWELLSREDALIAGMLTTGRISAADLLQISQLVGIRRYSYDRAMTDVRDSEPQQYTELSTSRKLAEFRSTEDGLLRSRPGQRLRVNADQWQAASEPALAQMRQSVQSAGNRLVGRATPIGIWVVIRLLLAGGLGLLAVIASITVSITTARALVRQLERLRRAAWELAEQQLPSVVERLGHGEKVDVAAEAPPLRFGDDEIGQVGKAFNNVQETAIRTAVEQAELRRGIRDVLLSLARRTQTLVHRQLSLLDTMERRRDIDPKELDELFRLDHLATRMRRNAENLIVLSGSIPARGWRRSVPMIDVVRAAVGEVEDYTRVQVMPFGPIELTGRSVGDVTHLLAELIENAVSFSPPDTVVQIGGHLVASGFAIDIEDRGLGMTDEKLAEINARIADPPEFNLQSSVQLGLFVVGKLAERYGLQVMLKRSAYGGTTAVVVIPSELIVEDGGGRPDPVAPVVPAEAVPAGTAESTGPRPVPAGTTTENGLTVRQPTMVGAAPAQGEQDASPGAPAGPGQPSAPSLVAVPNLAHSPGPRTDAGPAGSPTTTGPLDPAVPAGGEGHGLAGGQADDPSDAGAEGAASATPEDLPPVPEIDSTPSGLPVRVPQANLAPPLRTAEPLATQDDEDDEDEDPGRSPEDIKRIMGSYQRGTRRGRSEAARSGHHDVEGEDDQ